jgi:ornithine cyclodeaminase/alanine dehydrogenase-like protein (mu-crystallin family)
MVSSIQEVAQCDIVCTTTPARNPILRREWIPKGTHINAMGADAPGKQELEDSLVTEAKVVVDDYTQAIHSGEINMPIYRGVFRREKIYSSLGEIVAGIKVGREKDEITIFDSTGLAIQDLVTAKYIYELARKKNRGSYYEIV